MGDSIRHEMSLEPVDTGRRVPGISPVMNSMGTGAITPPFNPDGSIPGVTPGSTGTLPTIQPGQPGAPITRMSFLSAFLANLGPALAGGLAQSADPRFPFGTGLPGALGGIEKQKQINLQNQFALNEQQRQNALAQSQLATGAAQRAYTTAETNKLNLETPFDVQQKKLSADLMQSQILFYQNPSNIDAAANRATANLGPLSGPEQAQIDAAKIDANLKRSFDPVSTAVSKIAQDRITGARQQDTSAFKAWRDQFIKENGRVPNTGEISAFNTAGAQLRISGMENLRQDNYLDTSARGGSVATMTAGEFAAANKAEPGRYVKYNGTVANTLKAQSFISDIRDGMKQMQAAVDDPNFQLSSTGRALMSVASKNPATAVSTVMAGLAAQNLSEPEQNYLIAHASLLERAMSLRSLQGQGAGSDQQRAAIANLVPGLATADKNVAGKLLKTLGNNVDNVEKAFPTIGNMPRGNAGNETDIINSLVQKYGKH